MIPKSRTLDTGILQKSMDGHIGDVSILVTPMNTMIGITCFTCNYTSFHGKDVEEYERRGNGKFWCPHCDELRYGRVEQLAAQQTVNLPPSGIVGSSPTSPTQK